MISKHRKLSLSALTVSALCVLAFAALPAVAGASPVLSTSKGKPIAVGTVITFSSTNARWVFTGVGTESCALWEFHGVVESNTGTEVVIGGSETLKSQATGCLLNGVFPIKIEPTLETLLLAPTSNTINLSYFSATLSSTWNMTNGMVVYTPPKATTIEVEGPVTGTSSGTFTGGFTLTGGVTLN